MSAAVDLCQVPAGVPPDGTFNLVDPVNLESELIGVSVFMTAWSLVLTIGRFYTHLRKLSAADYFAMAGFVLTTVYTALCLNMYKYSRHQWDVPACWFTPRYMKILFAQGTILGPVIGITKASILLLYLQLFGINARFRYAVYAGLVLTFLTYFPSVPLEAYYAAPHIGQTWEDLLTNGMPQRLGYWGLVQGPLAVVVDLYLFILPLPVIRQLHLTKTRRMGLAAVFATALMGVIASVVALGYRVELFRNQTDSTWPQTQLFICVIVENNVALIVSSVPGFATFIRSNVGESWFFKSLKSRISGRSRGTNQCHDMGMSGGADGSTPRATADKGSTVNTTISSSGYYGGGDGSGLGYHQLDELENYPPRMPSAAGATTSTDGLVQPEPYSSADLETQQGRQRYGIMVMRSVDMSREQQQAGQAR